jgi:hypothetical protein
MIKSYHKEVFNDFGFWMFFKKIQLMISNGNSSVPYIKPGNEPAIQCYLI